MTTLTSICIGRDGRICLDELGNLRLASNADAVAQACTRAMSTLLGELQFNTEDGVDYVGTVFAAGQDALGQFISSATSALSGVTGVERVTRFDASFDADTLKYTASIVSVFGEIIIKSET